MIKVHDKIYVGDSRIARALPSSNWSFVNVSSKYHYELHGWQKGFKYADDPCYITCEKDNFMSVNWIDASAQFYDWQGKGVETFIKVLDFIEKQDKQVYIFCDKGHSRSPSVALLYLSKRLRVIPSDSFEAAKEEFLKLYPMYEPGGIKDFITSHWEEIV